MTYSEEEQKVLFLFNENFTHNVILCIFESDNIINAPMDYIILRVSQTRQKENAHHYIICKKDSQTYFSLMRKSVVNVGREEQRCQFDSLVNKQKEETTSTFLFPYMIME
jgi:hypothetical protein